MGLEGKAPRMAEGILATVGMLPPKALHSVARILGVLWHRVDSKHRSVAIVEQMREYIEQCGMRVRITHRDIEKG